ncbi:GW dipeptide domain-containing protein [Weissella confusa]|uniref:GW dipeptide domain-containing protein n=1 Tax=Weissella confusa TaxID=1583 RepID=UPI00107EF175|nr:GW dipeptide domain-containing protein [Weissella confusa]TGE76000.1 hypothetical protein C6P10_06630 [Weissella confusa]
MVRKNAIMKALGLSLAAGSVLGYGSQASADTASDFVNKVGPASQTVTKQYGLYASVQIAQASLESGWGQSGLTKTANNYFGIKGSYNGQSVIYTTAEDDGYGNLYYVDAAFKKYPSAKESMEDNARLLRNGLDFNHAFYSGAWRENAANYSAAANSLTGKYATDTTYGSKLINLIRTYGMDRFDKIYDSIVSKASVLKVGTVYQNGRSDGIYENAPWNVDQAQHWVQASQVNGMHVLFDQEVKTSNTNNVVWGSWVQSTGKRAYIDEAAISGLTTVQSVDLNVMFNNDKTGRNDGIYKTAPNNFLGNVYQGSVTSKKLNGKYVHVSKRIDIDGMTWYGGVVNGTFSWFDSRASVVDTSKPTATSYFMQIKQNGRNDGIYYDRPFTFQAEHAVNASKLNNQYVQVTSEWKTADGITWLGFSYNGRTVYMDSRGFASRVTISQMNTPFIIDQSAGRNDGIHATSPHGVIGSSWYGNAKDAKFNGANIRVTKKVVLNGVTWYGFNQDGKQLWIDALGIKNANDAILTTDYTARINQNGRNDAIYLGKPWEFGGVWTRSAKEMQNADIEVLQTWKTADGVTWVGFMYGGKMAYMDSRGTSTIGQITKMNQQMVIDQTGGRNDGLYLNTPYNFSNSEFYQYAKDSMNGVTVNVTKSMKSGNGVTWYYFNYNGKGLWIDSAAMSKSSGQQRATDYSAQIVQNGRNDGIYYDKPYTFGAAFARNAHEMNGADIEVVKEWTTNEGVTWVGFMYGNRMVYMDSRGVKRINNAQNVNKQVVINQASRDDGLYLNTPYNFSNNVYYGSGKSLNGKVVTVTKVMTSGFGTTWYQFSFNGKLLWIDAAGVR